MKKTASSEVAWALLAEGVTSARLEAHRLRHLLNRALALVGSSAEKEHLYQVAGDVIVAIPERLQQLDRHLDRTTLALTQMGQTFLEARLPITDKQMVEDAIEPSFGGSRQKESIDRVTRAYLARKGESDGSSC